MPGVLFFSYFVGWGKKKRGLLFSRPAGRKKGEGEEKERSIMSPNSSRTSAPEFLWQCSRTRGERKKKEELAPERCSAPRPPMDGRNTNAQVSLFFSGKKKKGGEGKGSAAHRTTVREIFQKLGYTGWCACEREKRKREEKEKGGTTKRVASGHRPNDQRCGRDLG